jgi:hypothetical protein
VVVLTNADSGRAINVARGTAVVVYLTPTATTVWDAPTSDAPAILDPAVSRSTAAGAALGVFEARAAGETSLRAVSRCRPVPGRVCNFLAILWTADVTVR